MNTNIKTPQCDPFCPGIPPDLPDVPGEQSHYWLSLLLNNTDEAVFLIGEDRTVMLYNYKALHFVQTYSEKALARGIPFLDFVEPDRKDMIREVLDRVFTGATMDIELPVLYRDGAPVYLVNQFKPVYDNRRQIIAVMVSTRDFTVARIAEQALKVSEDRWKFALNGSNHGLWDWDLKTGKMFFSDSFKKLHGYTGADIGDHYTDWSQKVHPDDKEAVASAIKTHLEGEDPYYESVYRMRGKDGRYKWIHVRGHIVEKDADGTPLCMIGTYTDITTQKNAEESYNILFYSHPLPMFTYELNSLKILEVNNAALQFYDYSRTEFLNLSLADIRPSEDAILLKDIIGQLKDHSKGMRHLGRHLKRNGEIPFVEITGSQITFDGKKSRLVTVYDVTEKIKAEQQLKTSEKHYRLLFKSNPLPSWIYDVETLRFLAVNDAAIKTYGYTKEEFLNKTLLDIHPPADGLQVQNAVAEHGQRDNIALTKWEQITKDGKRIYVQISATPINYYGRSTRLVVANDITTMVLADEALAKSNERFKLATKATSDAIYDLDLVNNHLTWGEGMTTLFNHPAGNTTVAEWESLIHPDDRQRVLKSWTITIEHTKKKFWKEEYRFQRKDKSYRHIIDKGFLKRDESGTVVRIIGAMQDISEFKLQQEELVASNDRYQFASLATSDIIWDWNLETGTILWSENFTKVLGHPLPENKVLPEAFQDHFHPDDVQRVWTSLQETINDPNCSIFQEDFRYQRADGGYAVLSDRGYILRDAKGKGLRMIGAMRDITDQKYKTNLLELERQVYESSTSKSAPFATVVSVLLKGLENLHPGMSTCVLLVEKSNTIKFLAAPTMHPEFKAALDGRQMTATDGCIGAAIARKEMVTAEDIENDPLCFNFKELAAALGVRSSCSVPILDSTGCVVGALGIYFAVRKTPDAVEINSIERAQYLLRILLENHFSLNRIQVANDRFDSVMRATHDMIWDCDIQTGSFYRSKEGIAKVYGVSNGRSIPTIRAWLSRIHPEDYAAVQNIIKNILSASSQETFDLEYRFLTDQGTYNFVYDRGTIVRNRDGKPSRMIGAAQNITERKRLELELIKTELEKQRIIGQATIETQEQERSEIGKELHDNVNQVLTTTKLYLDLSQSNPELKDELIVKSTKNIIYVINEIRQLSCSLMNPTLGDLGLLDSITDLVENINLTRKVYVQLDVTTELETLLNEHQKLTIFRIVQEVLNNAIKHAKANSVLLSIHAEDAQLVLTIDDDGVGFDPVLVKKGSGLRNIQNRVYLSNATISLDSMPGSGCRFQIKFPTNINTN